MPLAVSVALNHVACVEVSIIYLFTQACRLATRFYGVVLWNWVFYLLGDSMDHVEYKLILMNP